MARTTCTKAQLALQLEQAHVAYELLLTKYEALLHERRAPQPTLPALSARRAAMADARAEAMATGRTVRAL